MIRRALYTIAAALLSLPWWRLLPRSLDDDASPEHGVGIALVGCAVCLLALAVTGQL